MNSYATLWGDRIIWISPKMSSGPSARPTVTILVGLRGTLSVRLSRDLVVNGRILLLAPDTVRSLDAPHGCYSLNLDPIHRFCRRIRADVLQSSPVVDLSSSVSPSLLDIISSPVEAPLDCERNYRQSELLLNTLFPDAFGVAPIDPRIDMVATWLRTHTPRQIDASFLGKLGGFSAGRLTHVFTRDLGLSPRRYLLWVKMRLALELLSQDRSLTDVAYTIGFSNPSHMSRVFKSYFALKPSFLSNGDLVQLHNCATQ
ncbi:AraC family transcriptional regulator [Solimonas sp. K1W22B-7]|uniref:AraC family transcriptional regulator n=1 Tax=Solimonas sp. K1W22B-7 TaxID=2303331 RepID=UPI0013C4DFC2|nr:AraC family transcriptional regulator [Solimonas sp. K1W22B-7]